MKKQTGTFSIILVVIVFVLTGLVYLFVKNNAQIPVQNSVSSPSPNITENELRSFQSELMKFSIEIPADFQVTEKFTTVTLANTKGQILVNRNGTNFRNLKDYLSDLDIKNKITLVEQNTIWINGYESYLRSEKYSDGKHITRVYAIYEDNWVFTISTDSESLYRDLDQIAQSFRYIP